LRSYRNTEAAELVLPGMKCSYFISGALVRRLFYFASAQNKFFLPLVPASARSDYAEAL
jgi:hypothetical protein